MFVYDIFKSIFSFGNSKKIGEKSIGKIFNVFNVKDYKDKDVWEYLKHSQLSKLKKQQLIEIATIMGKSSSGTKHDLICNIIGEEDKKNVMSPTGIAGFIYIVENPNSKAVKIGRTKKRESVQAVYKYLYNRYRTAYGPKVSFILYETNDMFVDEATIHNKLKDKRLTGSELFNCSIKDAKYVCTQITFDKGTQYSK